jgi:hypothetical protein
MLEPNVFDRQGPSLIVASLVKVRSVNNILSGFCLPSALLSSNEYVFFSVIIVVVITFVLFHIVIIGVIIKFVFVIFFRFFRLLDFSIILVLNNVLPY